MCGWLSFHPIMCFLILSPFPKCLWEHCLFKGNLCKQKFTIPKLKYLRWHRQRYFSQGVRWQHWVCTSCCARGSQVELLWHSLLLWQLHHSFYHHHHRHHRHHHDFFPRSRLEVCSSLAEGGLTPSTGLVRSDCLHYRHLHLVCITITNLQHNSIIVILVLNRVITENVAIPAFAMLRPRGGDFVYTKLEQEVCNTQLRNFTSTPRIIVWPGYEERYWESDWMWSKGSFFLVLILILIIHLLILLIVVNVTIICSANNRWWYLKRPGPGIWLFDR